MKSYGESESKLKQLIKTQQQEMKDQEDKFNQAGNPDYDYVIEMEKCMHTKLEQFGRELKDNLLKEVSNNHRKIEEKLNQAMSGNMSFADKVMNADPPGETYHAPKETTDFRTIMKVARNEELAEESEKKQRACNIIIHGVKEDSSLNKEEASANAREFVTQLIGTLGLSTAYKNCLRIGKFDPSKKRPIKVVLNSEAGKNNIMENLKALKGQESFRGISLTYECTVTERQLIKEYSEKAKENNRNEPPNSRYVSLCVVHQKTGFA